MKIAVVGSGKVGATLIRQLSGEGHEIVVVDSNAKSIEESQEKFDVIGVVGNGASMETLVRAGVNESTDLVIAATSGDEVNILCCIMARKLGCRHTIARVRNPEYAEQLIVLREELGLSLLINPEASAAREIFRILKFPSFLKRDSFAKGRVEIVELKVTSDSKLKDVPLHHLYKIAGAKVLVCAVERKGEVFIPGGNFILQENDRVSITAQTINLTLLIKNLGIATSKIRKVMIIGGSRIAYYLAEQLLDTGVHVKIIEQKHDRCVQLSQLLPGATIIEADGTLQQVLYSEGLEQSDAVVTLTDMDEENLIISMYANVRSDLKIITKINRVEYNSIFSDMGIGSVVCPKELCATEVVRYVRAMQNTTGGGVLTLHRIVDGKAEALEFRVDSTVRFCDTPLRNIPLKQNVLIACITHANHTVIPDGDSSFTQGDAVVVVTAGSHSFQQMNDIFNV